MTQPQFPDQRSNQATQAQGTTHPPEAQASMARPTPTENLYREGYLHGRYAEAGQEDSPAQVMGSQAQGSSVAGWLLGILSLVAVGGTFSVIFAVTQWNLPSTPAPEQETPTTTIERTIERTQDLVPVPAEPANPLEGSPPETPSAPAPESQSVFWQGQKLRGSTTQRQP